MPLGEDRTRGHSISQASLSLAGRPLLEGEIASRRVKPSAEEPIRHQGCVQPTLAKISSAKRHSQQDICQPRQLHGTVAGANPHAHSSSDCLLRHSARAHNVSAAKNIDRVDLVGLGY